MTTFDLRDIRRTMDVYTADNVYLGSVLGIEPAPDKRPARHDPRDEQPPEPHAHTSTFNGERLGPAPTADIGNAGPSTQSARRGYGAASDGATPIGRGVLRVGKWWGIASRHTIALDAVQAVSLERVVLHLRADEL